MRANRKFVNDDAGQVGIGTMIVFIATILVAAVAAGVLIDTSGKLQERSARTGNEATEKVSGNLEATSIVGLRNTTGDDLDHLYLDLTVAPGAPDMDLAQLQVQLRTPTDHKEFKYGQTGVDEDSFNLTSIRDVDTSFSAATPVVNAGDLVRLGISTEACSCALAERKGVDLTLVPEVGNAIQIGFTTPASFGANLHISLI